MKFSFGTICLAAVVTFCCSCKKDVANTSSGSLMGTWELRHAQTGMMPNIDYATGNGNMLVFSATAYEKYINGTLVKSGTYTLVADDSAEASVGLVITPGQFKNRIIFDNDIISSKTFIEVSNNRLTLLSGYFPLDSGSDLVYERIGDKR